MNNRLLLIRIAILAIALASLLGAYLIFPLCLEEYNQRLIESADWDEVVGLYFVMPWAPVVILGGLGLFCLIETLKQWMLNGK